MTGGVYTDLCATASDEPSPAPRVIRALLNLAVQCPPAGKVPMTAVGKGPGGRQRS
jgi:hypothetical protein